MKHFPVPFLEPFLFFQEKFSEHFQVKFRMHFEKKGPIPKSNLYLFQLDIWLLKIVSEECCSWSKLRDYKSCLSFSAFGLPWVTFPGFAAIYFFWRSLFSFHGLLDVIQVCFLLLYSFTGEDYLLLMGCSMQFIFLSVLFGALSSK